MKIIARRGETNYLHEMDRARVELEYKGLAKYVDEMFYDSNSCCCDIKTVHFLAFAEVIPWWEIEVVCNHHISQFDLDGRGVRGKDFSHGE
ncbi:MAG: hypothetical protein ACTS6J_12110 [Burkholderiales bacterium]